MLSVGILGKSNGLPACHADENRLLSALTSGGLITTSVGASPLTPTSRASSQYPYCGTSQYSVSSIEDGELHPFFGAFWLRQTLNLQAGWLDKAMEPLDAKGVNWVIIRNQQEAHVPSAKRTGTQQSIKHCHQYLREDLHALRVKTKAGRDRVHVDGIALLRQAVDQVVVEGRLCE